ncbi:glycosyltransferase family 2 protein [bacterium]|nr:MAG: glycosyltransferase family 2 protein [bacterium]
MIYIIIAVHNRKQFTHSCLESLFAQSYKDFKVIIIDDGSTDGTGEMIRKDFPSVIVLQGDGNLWWSRATNLGVEYALRENADYILTLNDDTIASEDFLQKMMFWAEKYPTALLGAFAVDADNKQPFFGGEIINWKTASSTYLIDVLKPEDYRGLHEVFHFPGRGLLIPSEVFRKTGMYSSESFPQLAADYDFTHRAYRSGYKIYCNYDAIIFVFPRASGDAQNRKNKSWKSYYNHLFGIKGGGNLRIFWLYARRNCPKRYLLFFLVTGSIRRIFGYLIDWISVN